MLTLTFRLSLALGPEIVSEWEVCERVPICGAADRRVLFLRVSHSLPQCVHRPASDGGASRPRRRRRRILPGRQTAADGGASRRRGAGGRGGGGELRRGGGSAERTHGEQQPEAPRGGETVSAKCTQCKVRYDAASAFTRRFDIMFNRIQVSTS